MSLPTIPRGLKLAGADTGLTAEAAHEFLLVLPHYCGPRGASQPDGLKQTQGLVPVQLKWFSFNPREVKCNI